MAGAIFDGQGNRFTPSHAVKNGKRYRYYVSQAGIQKRPSAPTRIPAHEIEKLVSSKLRSFLESSKKVAEILGSRSDDLQLIQTLVTAAQDRLKSWAKASPAEMRDFMRAAVSRIVVYDKHVEIFVSKLAMRQALLNQATIGESKKNAEVDRLSPKNLIRLIVQAQLMRCGGEVRLVLPAGSAEHTPERPVPALIKAIARAHDWYGRLVSGEVEDQRSIATLARLDERYVSRILRYAFLAPEIVEAILQGRHTPGLTLENVRSRLPIDWRDQRKLFGFPLGSRPSC